MARESYEWSEEFQQKLLALYVREPQSSLGVIEPAYFTDPIFREISKLAKETLSGQDRDTRLSKSTMYTLVKNYLGKKRKDLWRPYRKIVKELYREDLSDKSVVLGQALAFAKEQKFRQALIDAEKDVNNRQFDRAIRRMDDLKGFGGEKDLGLNFWEEMGPERWKEDREGIVGTFYLKKLDKMMGGGPAAGELVVILGGGKVGKTTFLGRFAAGALWKKKNVAIATGELSAKKYRKRIDSMVTGLPGYKLTRLVENVENAENSKHKRRAGRKLRRVFKRLALAKKQMKGELYIKEWPTNKGTVQDIENWLDELKQKGVKIDVLFVDYLRTFRPNERYEDTREKLGLMAMGLRGLAGERGIPVWTASQTHRAALDKENIGPQDLAEDISIFWTLDFLIAISQTPEEKGSKEDRKKGKPEKMRLYLTSARDVGSGGKIDLEIARDTFVIREKEVGRAY